MDKKQFIPTIAPIVVKVNKEKGNKLFNSVVIAQAICESGWGQSQIMMRANAIFGIKAGTNWQGKVYNTRTKECYDGINYTDITACFRAYDNLEDSIRDYFNLILGLPRYSKALNCSTPETCITAIKMGGYATSPTYVQTIMSIINSNNLTKYDNETQSDTDNYDEPIAIYHEVRPGETLSGIAQRYNTTYQKIASDNGIKNPNLIYPGTNLKIYPNIGINNMYPDTKVFTYEVIPGDTLSEIAQKYGTTYQKIASDNGIKNPNLIYPGQKLVIK